MELTPEMVGTLSTLLGVEKIDTADALLSAATSTINELREDNVSFLDERDKATAELSAAKSQIAELSAATGNVLTLSRAPDDLLELSRDAYETRLDAYVSKGKLSAADAKEFARRFLGSEGKPNAVYLSRAVGASKPLAHDVMEFLENMTGGVEHGEKTGIQALSRAVPDADDKATPADPWADHIAAIAARNK